MYNYAVVLTGGIATGKSSVANLFKKDGWSVIDADEVAHEVLKEDALEIAKLFEENILNEEGSIDRKALANIVFGDKTQLARLEATMHPKIEKKIVKQAQYLEEKKEPYIVDIPLFFEKNKYPIKKVLVVYAPQTLQINRLVEQKNYTKEEATARIGAQLDIESKKKKADYLIDNSGTLENLQKQYDKIKADIVKDFE